MPQLRWFGTLAVLSLVVTVGYTAGYYVTSGADEPTLAPKSDGPSQTPAKQAAPKPSDQSKPVEPLVTRMLSVRTCPLYCFAEISEGEPPNQNTAHYFYAIEYLFDSGPPESCTMQGLGMIVLDNHDVLGWQTCKDCPGGTDDKKPTKSSKAKLKVKVKDPTKLQPARNQAGVSTSTQVGEFYVLVPLAANDVAKVLVRLYRFRPVTDRPGMPPVRTRIQAIGVEVEPGVGGNTELLFAQNVTYSKEDHRVRFEVDGIHVEALVAEKR